MNTAKYINLNQSLPIGEDSSNFFTRVKTSVSSLNTTTIIIILSILSLIIIAGVYYYYYVYSKQTAKYQHNSENMSNQDGNGGNAELLFFFAEWCPHCKTAKPIWNDLKNEYQNKTINGYHIIFTEINCSEETAEVEKMMNQYNVEGYPTIKLLKDGQIIEYDAKPSKDTLTQFLNTVL